MLFFGVTPCVGVWIEIMMILATGGAENTATQVTALIMAGASVIAYIIGEGLTDAANIEGEVGIEVQEDTEE